MSLAITSLWQSDTQYTAWLGLQKRVVHDSYIIYQAYQHVLAHVALALHALCAFRAPQLLAKHMHAAAPLVLGAFQEQQAAAHGAMWEMILSFAKAQPSAWHVVDMRKAVLPRLLTFLRFIPLIPIYSCGYIKSRQCQYGARRLLWYIQLYQYAFRMPAVHF